jgi:nicotinamide riboside kinase
MRTIIFEGKKVRFRNALIERKMAWVDIGGTWEERFNVAVNSVEKLLRGNCSV